MHGEGILVDEPSVVAVDETGEVYAVGSEAERMLGALAWGLARLASAGPGAAGPPAPSSDAERARAPAGGRAVTA